MIVDRISYKKVFPLGSYVTEHIGLEASLSETDNPQTELEHLKVMVEQLHAETLTQLDLYRGTSTRVIEEVQTDKATNPLQGSLDEIEKCETLEDLGHCWIMSKGNLQLSQAWKAKEKKLKDGNKE